VLCALIYKRSTHLECRDAQFAKFKRTYLFVYLLATGRTSSKINLDFVFQTCPSFDVKKSEPYPKIGVFTKLNKTSRAVLVVSFE